MKSHTPLCDQLIGSAVNALNQARIDDMVVKLSHQDIAFVLAREQMQKVREFYRFAGQYSRQHEHQTWRNSRAG